EVAAYLGTRPVTARLPWDHIDVGLEDGFLLSEYRKALKGRASPPCGKIAGMLIHHTNLAEAEPDRRKLVCYDCGVACDLSKMRDDRLVALRALGATEPPAPRGEPAHAAAELVDVSERGGGSPAERADDEAREHRDGAVHRETDRAERVRLNGHHGAGAPYSTYRIGFAKIGRAAFLGHLDLIRLLARSFRRADLPLAVTRGFSPKPRISFGPALGLGVPSLGELMDADLEHVVPGLRSWEIGDAARTELSADEVAERLAAVCPPGIEIRSCAIVRLAGHPAAAARPDLGLGKLITAVDIAIKPAADGIAHDAARLARIAAALIARPEARVSRGDKSIDVRPLVQAADVIDGDAARSLCAALDWPDGPVLRVRIQATAEGSAKPSEVARALGVWGPDDLRATHALVARLGVVAGGVPRVPTAMAGATADRRA
ncbi:MAG TPA: TIGR03936 family radical SAM-associated protein, partial [Kofleriaceae bacterium]